MSFSIKTMCCLPHGDKDDLTDESWYLERSCHGFQDFVNVGDLVPGQGGSSWISNLQNNVLPLLDCIKSGHSQKQLLATCAGNLA